MPSLRPEDFPALLADVHLIAHTEAKQQLAKGRAGRNQHDLAMLCSQLQASSIRSEQQALVTPQGTLQPHQCAELDTQGLVEIAHLQAAPGGQGLTDFFYPARLPGSQIGGFQAARIVFVLCFAFLIGGRLVGRLRGADGQSQVGFQAFAYLVLELVFFHWQGVLWTGVQGSRPIGSGRPRGAELDCQQIPRCVAMSMLRCLCVAYLLVSAAIVQAADGPLTLYTEEYPPLNFSRAGKPVGLGVEVVEEILRRTGQQGQISVVPWARGYQAAQSEPNTGLFVTMRTAEREQLFKWVGPIIVGVTSFYALKGSGLQIASLEQAAKAGTIAVPRQWYSYQTLKARGLPNLYGVIGPQQMMNMLRRHRVPLVVADNVTLSELLALGELRPADVEPLYSFMRTYAYIAFSPQTDDALISQWQRTLDEMKADGSFATIYQRWLPDQEMPDEMNAPLP